MEEGEEGGGPSVRRVRVWQNVSRSNDRVSWHWAVQLHPLLEKPVVKLAIPHHDYLFTPLPSQKRGYMGMKSESSSYS